MPKDRSYKPLEEKNMILAEVQDGVKDAEIILL